MVWISGDVQKRAALRRGFIMHNEHMQAVKSVFNKKTIEESQTS